MDRSQTVIRKVVDSLCKENGVAALVLAGSRVKGNRFSPDEFSDIELYIVAFDENFEEIKKKIQSIQETFVKKDVILAYKNQWAGWSVLFTDLLRLELPLVKSSDAEVFARSKEQRIEILYSKPGFILKHGSIKKTNKIKSQERTMKEVVSDFWYMAVYAVQHIGRREIWIAREAVRISMQGKVKRLLQEIYHKDTLVLEIDRRIELTWSKEELAILRETSCSYDRNDLIRSFWANVKYAKELFIKLGDGDREFKKYEQELTPKIKDILKK